MGFPSKVFNETTSKRVYKNNVLFSLTMVLSHWVLLVKFLTRHILVWWMAKGECYESQMATHPYLLDEQ